jgi:hypothetical protein
VRSHFFRVIRYMRTSDVYWGLGVAAAGPALMHTFEKMSPTYASRAAINSTMRVSVAIGLTAGFLKAYTDSSSTPHPVPFPVPGFPEAWRSWS